MRKVSGSKQLNVHISEKVKRLLEKTARERQQTQRVVVENAIKAYAEGK